MVEQNGSDTVFTPDEYQRLRQLLDEDAIRNLTLRYSHYLDHSYFERLKEVFTPDIVCEFGPYGAWEGIESFVANYTAVNQDMGGYPFVSMHANTQHWIEWQDSDTAVGRRQLLDFDLTRSAGDNPLLWLGLYEDRYVRTNEGWRIATMRLSFFWPQRLVDEHFPGDFPGDLLL